MQIHGVSKRASCTISMRMSLWSTTLKSIGHVVHLLQDQASPQHARGEPHNHVCEGARARINQDLATRTYENFINYRLTSAHNEQIPNDKYLATNNCEEARWLGVFQVGGQNPPEPITQWRTKIYPVPQFSVQRKFFSTRNASDSTNPSSLSLGILNVRGGLGDYANRGFYTQDYQAGRYLSPPAANSPLFVESAAQPVQIPGLGPLRVTNLSWAVPDPVQPGFADAGLVDGRAPIISQTVWCRLTGMGCTDFTMLSLSNYNQMADMLAPRAIAYTAGLINFFFRGKLKIEAPVDGLFGAIDHSVPHTVDSDGYPICSTSITAPENWCTTGRIYGFTKLRLKVRNDTIAITESGTNQVVPQAMVATVAAPTTGVNAGLYAIARYHRNPCYKADLSGEATYNNTNGAAIAPIGCTSVRTDYQEISVSKPKVVSAAELNSATATALAFDFSLDPIPVNATDLIIQVVYRGQLGEETDGIALGSIDAREAGYVTMWNNTDWGGCNGAWLQTFGLGCTPAGTTNRAITTANLCVGSQILLFHNQTLPGGGGALGSGRYLRVAVLGDGRSLSTRARTVYGTTGITDLTSKSFAAPVRQSVQEIPSITAPFISDLFFNKRGRIGSNRGIPIYLVSGGNPQPSNDLGALDVGNLLPSFALSDTPARAEFNFPDVASSVAACPAPSN